MNTIQQKQISHLPDILETMANLSNDEVFTPPALVNEMLDMLPPALFTNPATTFLDPFSKSGVFLREIVVRLNDGLAEKIPDLQARINHILKNQVFGIATSELTALMARRSVYCAKTANNRKYAITDIFHTAQGNIIYTEYNHTWDGIKCAVCGVSRAVYDRGENREKYAYPFLHMGLKNIGSIFEHGRGKNMKFDVIIGNPPYQMNVGGQNKAQAKPLYHQFVAQAKKLQPDYLSMIIPARWYSGGMGLDSFRADMLADVKISHLIDYPNASDCFNGVEIKGGVCYFLWDNKKSNTDCKVITKRKEKQDDIATRPLKIANTEIFIRNNNAVSILKKVNKINELAGGGVIPH